MMSARHIFAKQAMKYLAIMLMAAAVLFGTQAKNDNHTYQLHMEPMILGQP